MSDLSRKIESIKQQAEDLHNQGEIDDAQINSIRSAVDWAKDGADSAQPVTAHPGLTAMSESLRRAGEAASDLADEAGRLANETKQPWLDA